MKLVLASRNAHKARELGDILVGWEVEPLRVEAEPPEETGASFRENARLKADFGRRHAPGEAWVVGEDSGLEVEGLGGAPGVRSARFAGAHGDDDANLERLLSALAGVEGAGRRARYVCELVALGPGDREVAARGELAGRIARERRGAEGFGYDPAFLPDGEERTVAELGNAWKAAHSHRAEAARALAARLSAAVGSQ
ncbi:MAG TPA: non-canonical purine NTP pyrophosphatase [Gaiellaceae bacterium]|nr:non-canonical purine NTP pyrophosphatase [Gaiellaceae bacterium]